MTPSLKSVHTPSLPLDISAQQVKHMVQTHAASAFFHIQILPSSLDFVHSEIPLHPNFHFSSIVCWFHHLFIPPTGLPPNHPTNHQIHLHPNPLFIHYLFLQSKWDNDTSPPTRWVLIQWLGLSLEDSLGERWDDLSQTFHLIRWFFPEMVVLVSPITLGMKTIIQQALRDLETNFNGPKRE